MMQIRELGIEEAATIVEGMKVRQNKDLGMMNLVEGDHASHGSIVVGMCAAGASFLLKNVS